MGNDEKLLGGHDDHVLDSFRYTSSGRAMREQQRRVRRRAQWFVLIMVLFFSALVSFVCWRLG
jgi:hypothetical protein